MVSRTRPQQQPRAKGETRQEEGGKRVPHRAGQCRTVTHTCTHAQKYKKDKKRLTSTRLRRGRGSQVREREREKEKKKGKMVVCARSRSGIAVRRPVKRLVAARAARPEGKDDRTSATARPPPPLLLAAALASRSLLGPRRKSRDRQGEREAHRRAPSPPPSPPPLRPQKKEPCSLHPPSTSLFFCLFSHFPSFSSLKKKRAPCVCLERAAVLTHHRAHAHTTATAGAALPHPPARPVARRAKPQSRVPDR